MAAPWLKHRWLRYTSLALCEEADACFGVEGCGVEAPWLWCEAEPADAVDTRRRIGEPEGMLDASSLARATACRAVEGNEFASMALEASRTGRSKLREVC
jgi:hypothetical protein